MCIKLLTFIPQWGLIVDREGVINMKVKVRVKTKKKKPTAFEIIQLIIEAWIALSALITAIKWW